MESIKSALYNVGILIVLAALAGVFLVLLPFLSPLMWAFLFGAVLFPAKKGISKAINAWIDGLEDDETPIVVGIVMLPINGLLRSGGFMMHKLITHIKIIFIGISTMISLRLVAAVAPEELCNMVVKFIVWNHTFISKIVGSLNLTLVLIIIASYGIAIFMLWQSSSAKIFTLFGQGLWILLIAYLCSFAGSFQVAAFLAVMTYAIVGFLFDDNYSPKELTGNILKKIIPQVTLANPTETSSEPGPSTVSDAPSTPLARLIKTKNHFSEIKMKMQMSFAAEKEKPQKKPKEKQVPLESDRYFKILFYACTATILWTQMWIFFICLIPMTIFGLKELCRALGFWSFLEEQWKIRYSETFNAWFEQRRNALVPVCLPGVIQLNSKLHKTFCTKLKSYVDDISACFMILLLVVCLIFVGVFFFFQIYSETIAVAQLGSNLINRTLTHRPDLVEMLPINMQSIDDIIDNAYKYSRTTIEDYLDRLFNETNTEQATKLKTQILSVWDRLIQSYMDRNNEVPVGPRVGMESVLSTLDDIVTTSGVSFSGLLAWAKSNVGMLMEISDSLLIVLKANVNLLFTILSTLISVVLGSGHAMLKFLFNSVRIQVELSFELILFLSISGHFLHNALLLVAIEQRTLCAHRYERQFCLGDKTGRRIGRFRFQCSGGNYEALAISWTFHLADSHSKIQICVHTISKFSFQVFGAHVVFLPSVLATVLAAAPFLETYWCCLPAFLDLWLSQDRFYLGLALFLVHFIIPPNFNPIIHSEIKGTGHPYLTALSIVGGMYLFGIEGAILGPLLLCVLVVLSSITVINLNSPDSFTTQSSVEESNTLTSPVV